MRLLIITQDDIENLVYHRIFAIIKHFKNKFSTIDVLYYGRCYLTESNSLGIKIKEGLKTFFFKPRFKKYVQDNITYYAIRRLPVDGVLSSLLQESWIFLRFIIHICPFKYYKYYDFAISEGPGAGIVAFLLKNLTRTVKEYIYDDTDYFPGFVKGIRSWLISLQERIGIIHASLVVSVSETLYQLRKKQGAKRLALVPNGVDYSLYFSKGSIIESRKHKPATLVYAGSLEEWSGLSLVIQSLPEIIKLISDIRLFIVGEGPAKEKFTRLVSELNLTSRIVFFGRLPYTKLPEIFAESTVGLIFGTPGKLWQYACPLKLFQYMAAGLPVVAIDVGETARLIKEFHVGITADYEINDFIKKTAMLLLNQDLLNFYSRNAKTVAKHYDWSILMKNYLKEIDAIAVVKNFS